jgi:hypothetical protein
MQGRARKGVEPGRGKGGLSLASQPGSVRRYAAAGRAGAAAPSPARPATTRGGTAERLSTQPCGEYFTKPPRSPLLGGAGSPLPPYAQLS